MILDLIPTTIRMSTPLVLTALGGIYSERSGVVNIALEGMMLMGTFGYVMGTHVSASTWLGLTIGVGFGAAIALLHAIATIACRADQIVSGVAINLLAIGITEFIGRNATSQRVEGMSSIGGYVFIVYLTPLLVVMSELFLFRTSYGLRLCAAGESTNALNGLGLSRNRWQYLGVLVSGILAAVGGCFLASEAHYFTKRMTAGRGYIALAAVIFGNWKPLKVGVTCILFGFAGALELSGHWQLPAQLLNSFPYLLTMIVLIGVIDKSKPPASLGKH